LLLFHEEGGIAMKSALMSIFLLAFVATGAWAAATCLPIINNNVTVDGLVVGADVGHVPVNVPPGCAAAPDQGWGGVLGQDVPLVKGTPGKKKSTMFLAAHKGGGASIDKINLAFHIESAPDLTASDQLTVYFQVDGSKGDWDPANDFALVFDAIGPAATPNNDMCTDPNQMRYFKRDAGNTNWVAQGTIPAAIQRKISYRYNQADPDFQLWELEIGIDLSNAGLNVNIAQGGQVGIGAKLYLFEVGASATTAYHYPVGLTPVPDSGIDYLPNQGGVTTATLDKVTVGNCTFDVVISSISGQNDQGHDGQFTVLDPNSTADFNQTTGAVIPARQNHFKATVTFVNPANIVENVAVPDSGNAQLHIKPWNGGFTGDFTIQNHPESFTQTGVPDTISVDWPNNKTDWNNWIANGGSQNVNVGHACFFVDLSGFAVDLPNGNEMQENLTYVSASTIKESFLIAAPKEARPAKDEDKDKDADYDDGIEYILRAHWDNLPHKFLTGKSPFKYRITNDDALRLKDLGKGYYSLRLKPGEQKHVLVDITGGEMPHPNVQYKLSAKAGGQLLLPSSGAPPLAIPVKAGSTVSILTRGLATIGDHVATDANGYQLREEFKPRAVAEKFLLPGGFYRPEDHIGAVIGSCDKFHTAFVIGTASTFAVPEHCDTLLLAINDIAQRYDDNKGEFEVNVVAGDPVFLPARLPTRGSAAIPQFGIPAQMQPGNILPQLVFDVGQRFKKRHFNRLIPTGYVAYAIYASHPEKSE
jgi:hypothetical protein